MTAATQGPVDRIVAILEESKAFRRVQSPITIGNVPFDFTAVLLGEGRNPDLVLVIDTISEDIQRTRQKIGGLGRAMDVVGSRRPITAILTGPKPKDVSAMESIARICRVLPVGTFGGANDDVLLKDWLSVLLPLPITPQSGIAADPIAEVTKLLGARVDAALAASIIQAAPRGAQAVQQELKRRLSAPFESAEKQLDDSQENS